MIIDIQKNIKKTDTEMKLKTITYELLQIDIEGIESILMSCWLIVKSSMEDTSRECASWKMEEAYAAGPT